MQLLEIFVVCYVILLVVLTVANFSKTTITFPELAVTVYASLIIPAAFASVGLVSDMYIRYPAFITKADCRLLLWITVATALFTDVFAYFVGVKFGKTKMAPNLSPKKSWEGAIGGVVCVLVFMLLFFLSPFVVGSDATSAMFTVMALSIFSYTWLSCFMLRAIFSVSSQ